MHSCAACPGHVCGIATLNILGNSLHYKAGMHVNIDNRYAMEFDYFLHMYSTKVD